MPSLAPFVAASLALAPPPGDNSPEAYRLDRLLTKALNDAAIARLTPVTTTPVTITAPRAPTVGELDLAARERRAIEAWRARRDLCTAGDKASCD